MKINLTIDDYCKENYQIIDLLKKYDLKATFFIECDAQKKIKQIKDIFQLGHHIGSHTITHAILTNYDLFQMRWEIMESKKIIENEIQQIIDAFCYPRGRYTKEILTLVNDAGYKWARTTKIDDKIENQLEIPVHIHCYQRKEYSIIPWLKYAIDKIDKLKNNNTEEVRIMAHGWELNRNNDWKNFEFLLSYLTQ